MSRWHESKTLKFIRLYKQNRCLWDPSIPEYKNKVRREQACQNIIKQMQAKDCTTTYSIKVKIKNLRSTYHQEVKKIKESLSSGDGSHDKPTLSWFYEMHSFLGNIKSDRSLSNALESIDQSSDVVQIEIPTDSTDQIDETNDSDSHFVDETFEPESIKQEILTDFDVTETNSDSERVTDENPPPKKRKKNQQNPIHYSEMTTTVNSNNIKEDEFYYFALNVAAQLRQLPLHDALQMQVLIQNKLLSARTKVLKTVKIHHRNYEESEEDSD